MPKPAPRRVLLLGATGTIGRATARALVKAGHETVCIARPASAPRQADGADYRFADVTDPLSLGRDGFRGEPFDVVISCLASRTGVPEDAWAIDHDAHVNVLAAAKAAGVPQMILLSAICVQKPRLAFQHAKLAFEKRLMESGLAWSIVRPTAYFKSLSGQIERVRRGKAFLIFGDGRLTACKPISDDDLARYLVSCIDDDTRQNRILPIGGPGDAITPLEQGERLFLMLGQKPRFRGVPVSLLDGIAGTLRMLGPLSPRLRSRAELARIGRYYATESMLVWDDAAGRYDADATPSFGTETLWDYYDRLIRGEAKAERGDHAVF
jgi:divinyl chlorophyllide a 8-vinyl-reductase